MIENYIGYIAATLTTISFFPQVIRVVTTNETKDISRNMYLLFNGGVLCWLIYGILKEDIPIIIANIVTFILSFTILVYKLKEK